MPEPISINIPELCTSTQIKARKNQAIGHLKDQATIVNEDARNLCKAEFTKEKQLFESLFRSLHAGVMKFIDSLIAESPELKQTPLFYLKIDDDDDSFKNALKINEQSYDLQVREDDARSKMPEEHLPSLSVTLEQNPDKGLNENLPQRIDLKLLDNYKVKDGKIDLESNPKFSITIEESPGSGVEYALIEGLDSDIREPLSELVNKLNDQVLDGNEINRLATLIYISNRCRKNAVESITDYQDYKQVAFLTEGFYLSHDGFNSNQESNPFDNKVRRIGETSPVPSSAFKYIKENIEPFLGDKDPEHIEAQLMKARYQASDQWFDDNKKRLAEMQPKEVSQVLQDQLISYSKMREFLHDDEIDIRNRTAVAKHCAFVSIAELAEDIKNIPNCQEDEEREPAYVSIYVVLKAIIPKIIEINQGSPEYRHSILKQYFPNRLNLNPSIMGDLWGKARQGN